MQTRNSLQSFAQQASTLQTGKQGADRHFSKFASCVRMDGHNLASSVPIRTRALFRTSSLGTHPKPRDRTSCELRFFAKRLFIPSIINMSLQKVLFQ
jgi:hypothetical protein